MARRRALPAHGGAERNLGGGRPLDAGVRRGARGRSAGGAQLEDAGLPLLGRRRLLAGASASLATAVSTRETVLALQCLDFSPDTAQREMCFAVR